MQQVGGFVRGVMNFVPVLAADDGTLFAAVFQVSLAVGLMTLSVMLVAAVLFFAVPEFSRYLSQKLSRFLHMEKGNFISTTS
ncbi:unnamed protein product [Gongylonema pulchrum]|uniref:MFS domain-containing protein n=1 Tax=Gongylonema pulchrum TaxID=637853 RepID=A0A183DJJ4_9BILA|nr:unnamed protein product [Gongylonema pulchrum]